MQKGYKHTKETREKMRKLAYERNNEPRLAAIPKGERHWRWSEKPSRSAIHKRINRSQGKARNFPCIDCGERACDWSSETEEYSTNPEEYKPRCRMCHLKKDKNWERVDRSKHQIIRDKKGRIVTTIINSSF